MRSSSSLVGGTRSVRGQRVCGRRPAGGAQQVLEARRREDEEHPAALRADREAVGHLPRPEEVVAGRRLDRAPADLERRAAVEESRSPRPRGGARAGAPPRRRLRDLQDRHRPAGVRRRGLDHRQGPEPPARLAVAGRHRERCARLFVRLLRHPELLPRALSSTTGWPAGARRASARCLFPWRGRRRRSPSGAPRRRRPPRASPRRAWRGCAPRGAARSCG